MLKTNWFIRLFELLSGQRGDNTNPTVVVEDPASENDDSTGDENEDDDEGAGTEDADAGSEDSGGKDREKFIPRDRFDEVNVKAKRVDALIDLGILQEDDEGELRLNPKHGKQAEEKPSDRIDRDSFRFKKEDIDDDSWPIAEKINQGFDYYEGLAQKMAFMLGQLRSENAIIRDYPEFIQKNSQLRTKAMDIMKNDPEFKKKYHGDPERAYWAVKRAVESLEGNNPNKSKKKPKSKFITAKGDAGKTGARQVDIASLTKGQLDDLEKKENDRINSLRGQK